MTLRLQHPTQVPPGGYEYRDPDTGAVFRGIVFIDVLRKAESHRKANHLPMPDDFGQVLLAQMCARWPAGWCSGAKSMPPAKGSFLGVDVERVKRGTQALFSLLRGRTVRKEQMEARAAVCRVCPARVHVQGCFGCSGIGKMASRFLGQDRNAQALDAIRTRQEVPVNRVGCSACGCYLPAKVWLSSAENLRLTPPEVRAKLPPGCWLFREGLK